jgi:hypothetical protein
VLAFGKRWVDISAANHLDDVDLIYHSRPRSCSLTLPAVLN